MWLACAVLVHVQSKKKSPTSQFLTSLFTCLLSLALWHKSHDCSEGEKLSTVRLSLSSSHVTLLFGCHPSKAGLISISRPPTSATHLFPAYSLKDSGRNDLCLCDIGVWLQSKLIWKADARTSYFTHWDAKVITVTPAEPWVANLVWGFPSSWWALTPRFVSISSIGQFQSMTMAHRAGFRIFYWCMAE